MTTSILTIDPGYAGGSTRTLTMESGTSGNNNIGSMSRDGYMFDGYRAALTPEAGLYPAANRYPGGIKVFDEAGRAMKSEGYWSDTYPGGLWQRTVSTMVIGQWMQIRRHVRVFLKEDMTPVRLLEKET